jgi:hypothetical protein
MHASKHCVFFVPSVAAINNKPTPTFGWGGGCGGDPFGISFFGYPLPTEESEREEETIGLI